MEVDKMNKRFFSAAALCACLLFTTHAAAVGQELSPVDHWVCHDYAYLTECGVCGKEYAALDETLTRVRALELVSRMPGQFSNGDFTLFGSGDLSLPVSRQELFSLAVQYIKSTGRNFPESSLAGTNVVFTDWTDLSPQYENDALLLVQAGVVNGIGENRLDPAANATFAQEIRILSQILQKSQICPPGFPFAAEAEVTLQNGTTGETVTLGREAAAGILSLLNESEYTFSTEPTASGGWSLRLRVIEDGVVLFDYTTAAGGYTEMGRYRLANDQEIALKKLLRQTADSLGW